MDQQLQQLQPQATQEIQAASAITGGVQANQDLPYMTPPILMPPLPQSQLDNNGPQPHQNFSGDSQDSSKFIFCLKNYQYFNYTKNYLIMFINYRRIYKY